MAGLKICLIKPPILHKGASFALMPTPPLGLAYIAGVLKNEGHYIQVIDASAEGINDIELFRNNVYLFGLNKQNTINKIDRDINVICFSFMFTNNWLYDRELVKEVKRHFPEALLIAGGEHANAVPEYCLKQAPLDYIVFGEGEETIVELIHAFQNKQDTSEIEGIAYKKNDIVVCNKKRNRITKINKLPWPKWDLFPLEKYFKNEMSYGLFRGNTLPVLATRGCPYECTFCSSPQMLGRKYEMRPPKDFIDELEFLYKKYNVTNFDFYDLTAIIKKSWIVAMCNEIIERGLRITYQLPSGTRSEAIDYEVAELLYKSGCKNITYAPESGSEKVLKAVKKKIKVDKMLQSISYSNKVGMNIKLNIIIGFPDDTHKDILQTLWFLLKCSWYGAHDTAPAVFSPYPGSELFKQLEQEGKVDLDDDDYIYEIINSYDLWPNKVYCKNISSFSIKFYVFVLLFTFYTSNYLFRPMRMYRTVRNIFTMKQESRLEQILYKNFISNVIDVLRVTRLNKLKSRLTDFVSSII